MLQDTDEPVDLRRVRALAQRTLHGGPQPGVVLLVDEAAVLAGQRVREGDRRVHDQRDGAVRVLVVVPDLEEVFGVALEVSRSSAVLPNRRSRPASKGLA